MKIPDSWDPDRQHWLCLGGEQVLPVGNVLPGAVVPVFLGQAEVDEKELVAMAANPHEEVVRLDVPTNFFYLFM
jgi:hypothetical protein